MRQHHKNKRVYFDLVEAFVICFMLNSPIGDVNHVLENEVGGT